MDTQTLVLNAVLVAAALSFWALKRRSRFAMPTQSSDAPKAKQAKPMSSSSADQPVSDDTQLGAPPDASSGGPSRSAVGTGLFEGVRTWGYQLQKVSAKAVAASPFDLMVIDYSKDGSDEQAFTPGDIARMKVKPDGSRRQIIAYMSIGEAESYRYYWNPAWTDTKPSWLLDENPDWKENFSVCYWDPGWQATFCGNPAAYLDKVIAAGFDGVYLDKCDVFEDLHDRNPKVAKTRPDMEGDMVNFVTRLSQYAKSQNPNFAIIMQNAEILLEHEPLREAIDGVAKEALLYGIPGPEMPNPKDEIMFARRALELALGAGRTVFVVEYLNDEDKIRDAVCTVDDLGFIGTVSAKSRKLDHLNPEPLLA